MSRTMRSFGAWHRLAALGAPDSHHLRLPGVTAGITPATPDRSVMNSVAYEDAGTLEAALDELAGAYAGAGVRAWTVWVPEADRAAAGLLERAGHTLDASPAAMGLGLDELRPAPGPEPDWSREWDLAAAGKVNDRAYGDRVGLWTSAFGRLPARSGHLYLMRDDGRPISFVLVVDEGDDCMFWFAATVPDARGRGLVGGLLHRALSDARERGCKTSTTIATAMGEPVYARLGYRRLGTIEMWERRG